MDNELNVLLIDDHPLYRRALKEIVSSLTQSVTIHESSTVSEALEFSGSMMHLDLILLDLNLPDANGLKTLMPISQAFENVPIAIVSANENSQLISCALDAGASGYIPKSSDQQEIINSLTLILNGGVYIPPAMIKAMQDHKPHREINPGITQRQNDVLQLMAKGFSNKQISRQLGIAETTVRVHVSDIMRLFQASNRTDAVIQAQQLGFVNVTTG